MTTFHLKRTLLLGIFSLGLLLPVTIKAQTSATLDVKPGELQEMLLDLDFTPTQLILKGSLNSSDLSYINKGTGRISNVTDLDISDISLEYDGGMYASVSGRDESGVGLGTVTRQFYLSFENFNDTTSSPNGLGGGNVVIQYYSNNLGGLFLQNPGLINVKLPKSINNFGPFIFSESNIENVEFPGQITELAEYSFSRTPNLKSIQLPSTLSTLGERCFYYSGITSLECSGLEEIGESALKNSKIEAIDLTNVKILGNEAFSGTGNLQSVDLSNLSSIPYACFDESGVSEVKLGENLIEIGPAAFTECKNLQSLKLPEGVKIIDRVAFARSNITEFNIPASVISIGADALQMPWINAQPTEDGVYYFGKVAYKWKESHDGVKAITIKEGTVSISDGFGSSYYLQANLQSLTLPSTLKEIGGIQYENDILNKLGVFSGCMELEEVILPEGVEIIGSRAFSGCSKMKMSSLPSSIKAIGSNAFSECSSINPVIIISEDFEYLGSGAFYNCGGISEVIYNANLKQAINPFPKTLEKITFGANVTFIPERLLNSCTGLVRLIFENSEAIEPSLEIGESAFSYCTSLVIEKFPDRLVKIGESAFEGVNFGENFSTGNLQSIAPRAFAYSIGIKELELTENLLECGEGAFGNIESLEKIIYRPKNLTVLNDSYYRTLFTFGVKSIVIGENVEYIPERLFADLTKVNELIFEPREQTNTSLFIDKRAFYEMTSLTSLTLPDVPTSIGESAFEQCRNLLSYHIGYGTEEISAKAFYNPSADLTEIDIPETVTLIGPEAFNTRGGANLTLYFHSQEPPAIESAICQYSATVFVPAPGFEAYSETPLVNCNLLPYPEAWVKLDQSQVSLKIGESVKLSASVEPEDFAEMEIIWLSLNPEIAGVNEEGLITALSEGETIIQAYPVDFPENIAECIVTVTSNGSEPGPGEGGVESIEADRDGNYTVYNLQGLKILTTRDQQDIEHLNPGLYIINGQKILIQKHVN